MKVLENAKDGQVLEIMCHPAYVDEDLINATSYNKHRAEEFRVLTSEKIETYIKENNIELIGFNEI
ncbi:ChbG/HpnK family deacetylase [Bacillus thuringiensis]|nr:ChbG/HpnK family deacetylase [Bacillus thuringiensis]